MRWWPTFVTGVVLACLWVFCASGASAEDDTDCEALRKALDWKQEKLAEYIEALRLSFEQRDMRLVQAFSHKVERLADEIHQTKELHRCPEKPPAQASPGLSPIKSDAAAFVTQSCGELRRMQVILLIKINTLRRREQSVFSQLSAEEKESLENAAETLKQVRNALKARCPDQPRKKSRRRTGVGVGHSRMNREVR